MMKKTTTTTLSIPTTIEVPLNEECICDNCRRFIYKCCQIGEIYEKEK